MNLRILYQDENLIAVDKPAGFHVHSPEDLSQRIPRSQNCVFILRKQTGSYVYPVHRLDRATSGLVLFALKQESASLLNQAFREGHIGKTYFAVVRGYTPASGTIDHPLRAEDPKLPSKNSVTRYETLARVELPVAIGKHSTTRYSLVQVQPLTGRMHQIRRHFAHISHPLIGDTVYGDGKHNRFFRERFAVTPLLLKAYALDFTHPTSGIKLHLQSKWTSPWHSVFDLFGICPLIRPLTGSSSFA